MSVSIQELDPSCLPPSLAPYSGHLVSVEGLWPPEADQRSNARDALRQLFELQLRDRNDFGQRVHSVVTARMREIKLSDGNSVVVQYNPGRKRNPEAFDPTHRPCFLEPDVIADDEKEIAISNLVVGYTPMPILYQHATAMYPKHVPQSFDLMLGPSLAIARMLGQDYFTYYNGPLMGASAPDHAHIQLAEHHKLPIENDMLGKEAGDAVYCDTESTVYVPEGLGRTAILIDGKSTASVTRTVRAVVGQLGLQTDESEPRLNMAVRHNGEPDGDGITRVTIFPRERAVPAYFNTEGPSLRPAALEMAGIIVTSSVEDYERVEAHHIEDMYTDVSTPRDEVWQRLAHLSLAAA